MYSYKLKPHCLAIQLKQWGLLKAIWAQMPISYNNVTYYFS